MSVSFGSLEGALKRYPEGQKLLLPAGPVSDAFIWSRGPRDLLNGPVGSGKTTACVKRALRSAIEQPPLIGGPDKGLRLYSLAVWRETYDQLWNTTIKSWQKVLDPEKGIGNWTGARPRAATHTIEFEDAWGPIRMIVHFQAFGDDADPDDLGGTEYTDAYLNEKNTLREDLFVNLARSVGRYPNRGELGLPDDPSIPYGRIFGDCNAPSPLDWVYRDFWAPQKPPGYKLFRQPGGRHPDAENLAAVGRQYYLGMVENNLHRPWWIRIKVDNEPGFNRYTDVVYPDYVDSRMASDVPLQVFRDIPVSIGFDGGNTPAAALSQTMPDGQRRILAEVALERGDEIDLARGLNVVLQSPRFAGCHFVGTSDPAMHAGDDTTNGSMASRLGKEIGLKIHKPSISNMDTEGRHRPMRDAMKTVMRGDRPGFVIDAAACPTIRRGLNGTFHYHSTRGTGDRGSIVKTPDSHAVEAGEYSFLVGPDATMRKAERQRQLDARRAQAAATPRHNPLQRARR